MSGDAGVRHARAQRADAARHLARALHPCARRPVYGGVPPDMAVVRRTRRATWAAQPPGNIDAGGALRRRASRASSSRCPTARRSCTRSAPTTSSRTSSPIRRCPATCCSGATARTNASCPGPRGSIRRTRSRTASSSATSAPATPSTIATSTAASSATTRYDNGDVDLGIRPRFLAWVDQQALRHLRQRRRAPRARRRRHARDSCSTTTSARRRCSRRPATTSTTTSARACARPARRQDGADHAVRLRPGARAHHRDARRLHRLLDRSGRPLRPRRRRRLARRLEVHGARA